MKNKLEEIKKLLIIVDMVNGFVREGMMSDSYIEHIIPEQLRLINMFLKEDMIAFIKDNHENNCNEFKRYSKHCIIGTSEAELVSEFIPYEKESLVYKKNSTSAIYAPGFITDIDKMQGLKDIVITGCCTDICVTNLVIPLQNYFDQKDRDVNIIIPTNAVETYNSSLHNREKFNEIAFKLLNQSGIKLVKKYK